MDGFTEIRPHNITIPYINSYSYHQSKVSFLETLSELIGCSQTFSLGDGTIPDVIRINQNQDILFIGDAKESETPGNTTTQRKLNGYLEWLKVFCQRKSNYGIFAICHKGGKDINGWECFMLNYATNNNIPYKNLQTNVFSHNVAITSFWLV